MCGGSLQIGRWMETFGSIAPAGAGIGSKWRFCTRPKMVSTRSKLSAMSRKSSSPWPSASEPQTAAALSER